jgi:prepilin signal peptidase PulO-like enzyme (type II secretory pathway)
MQRFCGRIAEHFFCDYPWIQNLANGSYKGAVKIDEALGIPTGIFIFLLIIAAAIMFWLGELAEKKFARPDITGEI